MAENPANKRHQNFKRELRAYHDTINRKNRYNLPKISGKLNMFEAEIHPNEEKEETRIEIDRTIPNTGLVVLSNGEMKAIGNDEKTPLTDFKYRFIEGAMGDNKMIISCVSDDGKIEYFDVDREIIIECEGGTTGIGTEVISNGSNDGNYHEIEYDKVKEHLMLPYLCGYRIKDMRSGKLLNKGVKHKKKKRR